MNTLNNLYWRITVIFHNLVERMFDIHSCEDCYRFTNYWNDGDDYYSKLRYDRLNWYCENCAISRAERQHERDFTNYWSSTLR